jgi:hypothetical protein
MEYINVQNYIMKMEEFKMKEEECFPHNTSLDFSIKEYNKIARKIADKIYNDNKKPSIYERIISYFKGRK